MYSQFFIFVPSRLSYHKKEKLAKEHKLMPDQKCTFASGEKEKCQLRKIEIHQHWGLQKIIYDCTYFWSSLLHKHFSVNFGYSLTFIYKISYENENEQRHYKCLPKLLRNIHNTKLDQTLHNNDYCMYLPYSQTSQSRVTQNHFQPSDFLFFRYRFLSLLIISSQDPFW